jgi:heavy metal sensor kinase
MLMNSIRLRFTLWYSFVFGLLLLFYNLYVFSQLSVDLRKEFDSSLLRTAATTANTFIEFAERKKVLDGAQDTVAELRLDNVGAAIYHGRALLAAGNAQIPQTVLSTGLLDGVAGPGSSNFATDHDGRNRLAALSFRVGGDDYLMVMIEPLDELVLRLNAMRRTILFGLPALLALAAACGFFLAKKSLDPVISISRQAERINAETLNERILVANPRDELGQLATAINALLARLANSFQIMRQFMADASHELRTPLAIVQGEAEVALSRDRLDIEYKQSLGAMRNQAKRMARIVNDMLELARADAGQQCLRQQELYLNDLVGDCCSAAQSLAILKGVHLKCDASEDISYVGDEELLRRMTVNLLDNAIHYTPPGGNVYTTLAILGGSIRLIVSDTGIGIPTDCVSKVFDRFYRVDVARSRSDGGSGLGLSIAKLAAEAHQGTIDVSSERGAGTTFTVSIPVGVNKCSQDL